jgi:anti-sigma-K factor RskA
MTDGEHDDILELLPLYVLDGLEPAERDRVAAHLAGCPSCQAEAVRLLALVSTIAASVPPQAPDPALRARVMQRATGHAPVRKGATAVPPPASPRARRAGVSVWLVRATMVLALGLIVWNVMLTMQLQNLGRQISRSQAAIALMSAPDTAEISLAGQGNFSTANGKAYVDPQSSRVVLVVQHLQPLAPEKTYQAWIITDAGPKSAGTFRVSEAGMWLGWLDAPFAAGGAIGVSLEPAGGSPQPTQVVLVGSG